MFKRIKNSILMWFRRNRRNSSYSAMTAGPTGKAIQLSEISGRLTVLFDDGSIWMKYEMLNGDKWIKEL